MKQILLDTSFLLSCVRNKIDFFEHLQLEGIQILIPKQVLEELKGLSKSKRESEIALKIIQKNKPKIIELTGKNTDNSIINFAKKNPEIIIATLDREIKNSIKNKKLVIQRKKKLELR